MNKRGNDAALITFSDDGSSFDAMPLSIEMGMPTFLIATPGLTMIEMTSMYKYTQYLLPEQSMQRLSIPLENGAPALSARLAPAWNEDEIRAITTGERPLEEIDLIHITPTSDGRHALVAGCMPGSMDILIWLMDTATLALAPVSTTAVAPEMSRETHDITRQNSRFMPGMIFTGGDNYVLIPDRSGVTTLYCLEAEALSLSSLPARAQTVPAECVGDWAGRMDELDIDLTFTLREDGSGTFVFTQHGHADTRAFTLQSSDNAFTLSPGADGSVCTGTFALEDGVLTLALETRFASGRTYGYSLQCRRVAEGFHCSRPLTVVPLEIPEWAIPDDAVAPAISADGRRLLIASTRNNSRLLPHLRDIQTGETTQLSSHPDDAVWEDMLYKYLIMLGLLTLENAPTRESDAFAAFIGISGFEWIYYTNGETLVIDTNGGALEVNLRIGLTRPAVTDHFS